MILKVILGLFSLLLGVLALLIGCNYLLGNSVGDGVIMLFITIAGLNTFLSYIKEV